MAKKKVMMKIISKKLLAQTPERNPKANQMQKMATVVLRKIKVRPPRYLYKRIDQRRIGLTIIRSTVPLRSMFGMKKAVMIILVRIVTQEPMKRTMLEMVNKRIPRGNLAPPSRGTAPKNKLGSNNQARRGTSVGSVSTSKKMGECAWTPGNILLRGILRSVSFSRVAQKK